MKTQTIKTAIYNSTECLNWGTELIQERHPITNTLIPFYATMRDDDLTILQTGLSNQYLPIQNSEIVALARQLSDFDIQTDKVEIIDHGKKIILQVTSGLTAIGDTLKNGKPDSVALRTTFLHDNTGKGALKYTPSPYRLICKNQLAVVSRLTSGFIRDVQTRAIYHNKTGQFQISDILETAKQIKSDAEMTTKIFNTMALKKLTNYDISDILEDMIKENDITIESKQVIEQLIFEADYGQIDPHTVWGVYNGITKFNDHYSSRKNPSTNNLVFGAIAKRNGQALDHLLQYVQV